MIANTQQDEIVRFFICTNKKQHGKCCADGGSEQIYEALRQLINLKYNVQKTGKRFKAVKTGCLSRCSQGPNIYVCPADQWYRVDAIDQLPELVEMYL